MDFGGMFRDPRLYERPSAVKAYRLLRAAAERLGLQVVLKTFYSPIPELRRLSPAAFERSTALAGVDWDLDAQLRFLQDRLAGAMAPFDPPRAPTGERYRYTVANPSYSAMDAAVLYAMIAALEPERIVELGSGQSSLVAAEAIRRSGRRIAYEIYDPYAGIVDERLPGLTRLHRRPAEDVPLSTFESLRANDILFVDTTHTVKLGSDVNFIVLEVLPRLTPGVVVHVHDVFLPFEYPRTFLVDYGLYWAEQYLLQAFLAMNPGYEILVANAALTALRHEQVVAAIPAHLPAGGSAFWIRRTSLPGT